MRKLTSFVAWYGRDTPPPFIRTFRAGKFSIEYQDGDLRYFCFGKQELIRRIYVAVRDVNWNTLPAQITGLDIRENEGHFQIEFDAFHQKDSMKFRWRASLDGLPDGTIIFGMDGLAETDFRYCRIGFCVLHPIDGISGSPYQANTPGGEVSGVLPEKVEPQRIENGFEAPLFPSYTNLTIELNGGVSLTTKFEGDLFEMEDQRNWTDGSFKTYCTPMSLGYPHSAKAGQSFHQKITIKVDVPPDETKSTAGDEVKTRLSVGDLTGQVLPDLGFGISPNKANLNLYEMDLLSELRPDHLKVELHLQDPAWRQKFDQARAVALQLSSPLELALFLTDFPQAALEELKRTIQTVAVRRVIVFHEQEAPSGTTSPQWMDIAREFLSTVLPNTPFVGGTNGNFAELNRQQPDISMMDGVAYPINPQVHAFDERSLVEAIEAQEDSVLTARTFCGSLPIIVSSVTLKPPFNQAAREEEGSVAPSELPVNVDPRQMSLFAAAWTVGSLQSLALGGATAATYYELTGWRGLLENETGSRLPEKFFSMPGMVYPLYWVFRYLAGAKKAPLMRMIFSHSLSLCGLALKQKNGILLLVSNLLPREQNVQISGLLEGKMRRKRLNEDSFHLSAYDHQAFLSNWQSVPRNEGGVRINLKSYETSFIEIESLKPKG